MSDTAESASAMTDDTRYSEPSSLPPEGLLPAPVFWGGTAGDASASPSHSIHQAPVRREAALAAFILSTSAVGTCKNVQFSRLHVPSLA